MYIQNPENFEPEVLSEIEHIFQETSSDGKLIYPSLNTYEERKFINGIIRQVKPKKILEVGVAAGGSSAIILNAIKDIEGSKLYSIDYLEKWWEEPSKNIGYIVEEEFSNLMNKWTIYRGGVVAKFIEDIGNNIDFCFLDASHYTPGEFLDFLMVLPFLKKNAVVMIHDVILEYVTNYHRPGCYHPLVNLEHYYEIVPNSVLFSLIKGKKITMDSNYFEGVGNIGAVILDDDIMEYLFDYFFILTLQWSYMPTEDDINYMIKLFSKYYDKKLLDIFLSVVERNKKIFNDDILKDLKNLRNVNFINDREKRLNQFLNSIAWWIPIRKLRDNFRNKILYGEKK
ncbi:class I SAM-dependent methyltransferase [Brachyspira intermedia]|uniref:class I SAM-dependent methyltransferase n=1 Tax=Brachyspira intermedia TaxID=84377 RepID=UPI003005E4FC